MKSITDNGTNQNNTYTYKPEEVLNLVMSQNGTLTQEQYLDVYDHSPTLECVFYDEFSEYEFELVFTDKSESILCNVTVD